MTTTLSLNNKNSVNLVKFQWHHPKLGAKYRWSKLKSAIFGQYLDISQKRWKTDIITMEG